MTTTIIFWVRMGLIGLLGYTLVNHLWNARKRGYFLPGNRADWKIILNDGFTLLIGGFALFMLEKNYQAPMNAVLKDGQRDLHQLSYLDINAGKTQRLTELRGKIVILNIWATWCPPCRRELPDLSEVQKKIGAHRLAVIALSDEEANTVADYVKNKGFAFTTGVFTQMPTSISRAGTRPISILLDPDGNIREMVVGARGVNFFLDWVTPLL